MPSSVEVFHLHLHISQMENPNQVEIALDEEIEAPSRTRATSARKRVSNSGAHSNPDVNAVVIQQVASLADSVAKQQAQIEASNANCTKISDMMSKMSTKFESLLAQPRVVGPEQVDLSDSEYSEAEEPATDPFAGLFDDIPAGPPEPEDLWAAMLSSTEAPAEFGPELPTDIAASMMKISILDPATEKVKAWKTRYLIPANAKHLGAPRVNPEIWALLDASRRAQDQQYQNCQSMISLSLVAQARVLATIREWHRLKKDVSAVDIVKNIGEVLMDSVSSAGVAQGNLNMKRRSLIKQAVPSLKNISFSRTQPTEFLFGDKVQEELKTAKAAQALMRPSFDRKRRPNSGVFGSYSGGHSRQFRDTRARPHQSLNYGGDSQRPRSSGYRKPPPQLQKDPQ